MTASSPPPPPLPSSSPPPPHAASPRPIGQCGLLCPPRLAREVSERLRAARAVRPASGMKNVAQLAELFPGCDDGADGGSAVPPLPHALLRYRELHGGGPVGRHVVFLLSQSGARAFSTSAAAATAAAAAVPFFTLLPTSSSSSSGTTTSTAAAAPPGFDFVSEDEAVAAAAAAADATTTSSSATPPAALFAFLPSDSMPIRPGDDAVFGCAELPRAAGPQAGPSPSPPTEASAAAGAPRAAQHAAEARARPGGFTYVELFAGIGGFRVALDALGGVCLLACEVDREAREVYRENFEAGGGGGGGDADADLRALRARAFALHGDVCTLHAGGDSGLRGSVDLVVGGFPCQPFSRLNGAAEGTHDGFAEGETRGHLFFELMRVVRECDARGVLLENVPQVCNEQHWRVVEGELEAAGYTVGRRVLNTSQAGLAQNRERCYIVAAKGGAEGAAAAAAAAAAEAVEASSSPAAVVADILEPAEAVRPRLGSLRLSEHQWAKVRAHRSYVTSRKERPRLVDPNGLARTLRGRYRSGYLLQSEFVAVEAGEGDDGGGGGGGGGDDDAAPRPRFFTPRECARLQGFPEDFRLGAEHKAAQRGKKGFSLGWCNENANRIYHMLGNAVAPPMVSVVARGLVDACVAARNGGQEG